VCVVLGTSLIAGPSSDVAAIAKKVGAKSVLLGKEYTIDCDTKLPDLTIILQGYTFSDLFFFLC